MRDCLHTPGSNLLLLLEVTILATFLPQYCLFFTTSASKADQLAISVIYESCFRQPSGHQYHSAGMSIVMPMTMTLILGRLIEMLQDASCVIFVFLIWDLRRPGRGIVGLCQLLYLDLFASAITAIAVSAGNMALLCGVHRISSPSEDLSLAFIAAAFMAALQHILVLSGFASNVVVWLVINYGRQEIHHKKLQ